MHILLSLSESFFIDYIRCVLLYSMISGIIGFQSDYILI